MTEPAWTEWGGVPTERGLWWQQFKDGRLQGVCYTEDDTPYNSVGIRYHGPHGGAEPPEEPKPVKSLWFVRHIITGCAGGGTCRTSLGDVRATTEEEALAIARAMISVSPSPRREDAHD